MKSLAYLFIGIFFGIIMYKSEAASWFRIYEMFKFQSFHMYGIIGSALFLGVLFTQVIKRYKVNTFSGKPIELKDKDRSNSRYILGGVIFGLGWALAGACPGPIFVLIGAGFWPVILLFLSAVLGTFVYGLLRKRLPH